MNKGRLYLLPTALGSSDAAGSLPRSSLAAAHAISYFIAENPKSARAFIKAIGHPRSVQELHIETLNEHTPAAAVAGLLQPINDGADGALLSEAGCPAVADPGADLVRAAHTIDIKVIPLIGPSALLLAIMASGMNGQRFAFHGYLPVARAERAQRIAELESESGHARITQVFIEAPYRNPTLLAAILQTCQPETLLCLATDLTLATEEVRTQPIALWRKAMPALARRPTVFLIYRPGAAGAQKR